MSEDEFGGVFPYLDEETGHTSGWSHPGASKDRAHKADLTGKTRDRQVLALAILQRQGTIGMTCMEMVYVEDFSTDPVRLVRPLSGVLSTLHTAGEIAMLKKRRAGEQVYVSLDFIDDRPTLSPKKKRPPNLNAQKVKSLRYLLDRAVSEGHGSIPVETLRTVLNAKKFREKE